MTTEPGWFVHLIDQRVALIEHALRGQPMPCMIIVNLLAEPDEGADYDKWERTCDRCKRYCPPPENFATGTKTVNLKNGTPVLIMFGFCPDCMADFKEE